MAHRRLNLLTHRRRGRLAHRRWSLRGGRGRTLRTGGRDGLGKRFLVGRLPRTVLGLGRALGKGRCRAGAHGRGDRTNLTRVDRLDLHASGCQVLADDLAAQGL